MSVPLTNSTNYIDQIEFSFNWYNTDMGEKPVDRSIRDIREFVTGYNDAGFLLDKNEIPKSKPDLFDRFIDVFFGQDNRMYYNGWNCAIKDLKSGIFKRKEE